MNILEWLECIALCCGEKKRYDCRDGELSTESLECHDTYFGFSSVGSKELMKDFTSSMTLGRWIEYGVILQARKYRKEEQFGVGW